MSPRAAAGTAAVHCHDFCGNADTLEALQEERTFSDVPP